MAPRSEKRCCWGLRGQWDHKRIHVSRFAIARIRVADERCPDLYWGEVLRLGVRPSQEPAGFPPTATTPGESHRAWRSLRRRDVALCPRRIARLQRRAMSQSWRQWRAAPIAVPDYSLQDRLQESLGRCGGRGPRVRVWCASDVAGSRSPAEKDRP